jgi:hypothetical protein
VTLVHSKIMGKSVASNSVDVTTYMAIKIPYSTCKAGDKSVVVKDVRTYGMC